MVFCTFQNGNNAPKPKLQGSLNLNKKNYSLRPTNMCISLTATIHI
jgi:hypothetical protein